MTDKPELDPLSDEYWAIKPTALEIARMDEQLRLANSKRAREEKAKHDSAAMIFGECLHKLTSLGLAEKQARPLLGKWRGMLKDDDRLRALITHAHSIATPDPVSYMTKAVAGTKKRSEGVKAMTKGSWVELGWEAPAQGPHGPKFRKAQRGKAWRDPFGKIAILPAKEGERIPSLDEDPGISE